jgi:hypothetical protein
MKMTKEIRFEAKTRQGSKTVTMTINKEKETYSDTIYADGWNVPTEETKIVVKIEKVVFDGVEVDKPEFIDSDGKPAEISRTFRRYIMFTFNGKRGAVEIPQEAQDAIFEEEIKAAKERTKRMLEADRKYEEEKAAVYKAMDAEEDR